MGVHSVEKKQLSAKGMLAKIRSTFERVSEPPRNPSRALTDAIALADMEIGSVFPNVFQRHEQHVFYAQFVFSSAVDFFIFAGLF